MEQALVDGDESFGGVLGFVEKIQSPVRSFFFGAVGFALFVAGAKFVESGFADLERETEGRRLSDEVEDDVRLVDFEKADDGGLFLGGEFVETAAALHAERKVGGGVE